MTLLDDDLAAIKAAPDATARNQALVVWLTDATDQLNRAETRFAAAADRFDAITANLDAATVRLDTLVDRLNDANERLSQGSDTLRMLKQIEAHVLRRGIVWNPERLRELTEEGD